MRVILCLSFTSGEVQYLSWRTDALGAVSGKNLPWQSLGQFADFLFFPKRPKPDVLLRKDIGLLRSPVQLRPVAVICHRPRASVFSITVVLWQRWCLS